MANKVLKQKGARLRLGDVIRILDKEQEGVIAVCIQDDGHDEYPWCCVPIVATSTTEQREEIWPAKYERIGNVVEMVALTEDAGQLVKAVRKLVRSSHGG